MSKEPTSRAVISKRASINWIVMIYFLSGACSLMDEVVWVRLLKLTLGNTVYATSVVVSIFMGGLALGALIMGRYSDRVKHHLRLYALLETLVTISALSLPWILKGTDRLYIHLYRSWDLSRWQLLVVQIVISAGVLLVPSMLMGSTLPLLGRFVTSLEKQVGHLVGRLYALNTLGAATGCFLGGFVLIRQFGVMGTLYIAAILNLFVAFGGWFLSRYSPTDTEVATPTAKKESVAPTLEKTTKFRFSLLAIGLFASGLISIGYELLWMRSIVHLLGGYTYVFSAVLTIYLLGNVIGAAISTKLIKKWGIAAKGFAVTLCILGLCGLFYLPVLLLWMSKLAIGTENIVKSILGISGDLPITLEPIVHCLPLFILPSIIMGMGFPMALQAWANHVHKVGRSTGTAYGANTIGAVLGGIVTGFVLIPLLGVQTSFTVLGLIAVWISAELYLSFQKRTGTVRRFAVTSVAVAITVAAMIMPQGLFTSIVKINPGFPNWRVLEVKEGITTTVSVHHIPSEGYLQLFSAGQSIAGDSFAERADQKLLGHFGVLLNKDTKSVLSVGFGSGETTACLSQHNLDRLDCAEIAPEVVEVALAHFTHLNLGDKLDGKVNMIFMDAKNYIHLTDTTYDLITNDSIHPRDFAENASLYAKEYFEAAYDRLDDTGMIVSWVPTYDMPTSVFYSIIGTLMDVFPNVTMWYPVLNPAPLVLLVGSKGPPSFSPQYIEQQLQIPDVGKSLADISMTSSVDVLSCYVADQTDLRKIVDQFQTNSDYSPFVEFTTDEKVTTKDIYTRFLNAPHADSIHQYMDWKGYDDEKKTQWIEEYQKTRKVSNYLFKAIANRSAMEALDHLVQGLKVIPDHAGVLDTRERISKILYRRYLKLISAGKSNEALKQAKEMLDTDPNSAWPWIIQVNIMVPAGDLPRALQAARMAVKAEPDNFEAHFTLAFVLFSMGANKQAVAACDNMVTTALARKSNSIIKLNQMMDMVAAINSKAGNHEKAVESAEKALEYAKVSGRQQLITHSEKRLAAIKAAQQMKDIAPAVPGTINAP